MDEHGNQSHAASASEEAVGKSGPPPFPPDATIERAIRLGVTTLNYRATVGAMPVRDADGRTTAEIVFTAYVADAESGPARPVTFVFNGGPGAASVFMNLGAIGPLRIQFGAQGDSPSDPIVLQDNSGSWLDFTDLVFVDPVGTGYSRSLIAPAETDKTFFTVEGDVACLARIIYDWLARNGRMASPKFIAGESYGGFRAAAVTRHLQTILGVGVSGLVIVSPLVDGRTAGDPDNAPLSWAATLPSMAAARCEREGKVPTPEVMAEVEAYAGGEFVLDLLRGVRDEAAVERIVARVAAYTGLDPAAVRRMGGRIDARAFLRELYRAEGRLGSWYDSNVTGFDPYPLAPDQRIGDPILLAILAPATSAMVDFVTREVGWKVDAHYLALNPDVYKRWEKHWLAGVALASPLREALAVDPRLRALIVHGYDDLSCPYFQSMLAVAQIPRMGPDDRLQVKVYPGGHMFYARPESQAALRRDVLPLYAPAP